MSAGLPGAHLLIAAHTAEAMVVAHAEDPDLILLDDSSVCRALKQDQRLQTIPVLFLTSPDTPRETRLAALQAGAEGFLAQPSDAVEAAAQIRAMAKIKGAADFALQAMETAKLGSWMLDLTGRISWSPEMYRIYAVSPETFPLNSESFLNLIHPEDRQGMQEWIRACTAGDQPGLLEFRVVSPDGATRWISGRGALRHDAEGRPTHMSGTAYDITERKLIEIAHRESEANLKEAQQTAGLGSWVLYPSGQLLWSDQMYRIHGVSPDAFTPSFDAAFSLIHPEDRPAIQERMRGLAGRGAEDRVGSMEFRIIRPDGAVRYISGRSKLKSDGSGGPTHLSGTAFDITERKLAEMALRESEANLKQAQATARLGSWIWKMSGESWWSEETYQIYGVPPESFTPTLDGFVSLVHPDDRPAMLEWWRATSAGEAAGEIEFRAVRPDGVIRYVSGRGLLRRDAQGAAAYVSGTAYDITERKLAEIALRESEANLNEAQATARLGSFVWSTPGRISGSDELYRIFGLSLETFIPSREAIAGLIHSADRPAVQEWISAGLAGKDIGELECRAVRSDGVLRHIISRAKVNRDAAGKPVYLSGIVQDITERKLAEAERERLQTAIEQADEMVLITDAAGNIEYVNPAFERASGYSRQEVIGKTPRILKSSEHDAEFFRELWRTISGGQVWRGRIVNKRKDGTLYTDEVTIAPVRDAAGAIVNYVSNQRDITAQLRLEAEFQQAQKMESVGRLAGGIAHDFNNLLTVINGNSELLLDELQTGHPAYTRVESILKSGERAARLTRHMLAFSRKQILEQRAFELDQETGEMKPLLAALLGADVEIRLLLGAPGAVVRTDPHQLGQVILNLAVNAKDAMPGGGAVTIQTMAGEKTEGPLAGPYVRIEVTDTGTGMSEETRQHIFEPFFTTKEAGKGTGLGLSMVHGFVMQSGGEIDVTSALGQGTTIGINLPRFTGAASQPAQQPLSSRGGAETVLVVEDEPEALTLITMILQSSGYRVLGAGNGAEALQLCEQLHARIDLLLTDVIMPRMSGPELARRLFPLQPAAKVLYMSGYTGDVLTEHGVQEEGAHYLQKPYRPADLLARVREVLDTRKPPRILVADDEPEVRRFLRAVLEKAGYEVCEAVNGKQAIDRAHEHRLDLMIVDLVMPEQEGLATIRALRQEMPALRIIAISGGFGSEFLHVAQMMGADAVMAKPLSAGALLARVSEVLLLPR